MRVFRLVEIEVLEGEELPSGRLLSGERVLGVFSSPENAEAKIRENIAWLKDAPYRKVLGYVLYENELDDTAPHGPWKQTPEFLSVRSYFADGTLNAFCDCDNVCEKRWPGRDPETIHYKCGDYVSVWAGDIMPALIGDIPRRTGTIDGDWTDDCYLAYSAEIGHWHPFSPYIFPLAGKLPERVISKIKAERDEWEGVSAPKGARRKRARAK